MAVRSRATRWSRLAAALVAGTVVGLALLLTAGIGPTGGGLFRFLVYLLFGYVSLAGVLLTADCLSVERREGTLGLLFLTDLRGYDVVLGKLAARGLTAFYGWLSTLPILSIALLLGGVTGGEFWRIAVALGSTLFLSLTTGLLVSSIVEEDLRAVGFTFLLLLGLNTVPQLTAVAWGWPNVLPAVSPLQLCWAAFDAAYGLNPARFWQGLTWLQALGWSSLLAACLILPRSWRSQGSPGPAARLQSKLLGRWLPSTGRDRTSARIARRVSDDPVAWLVQRTALVSGATVWTIVLVSLGLMLAIGLAAGTHVHSELQLMIGRAVAFSLRVLMAFQASRFIIQARQSGALELLLSTPLPTRELLDGQIRALQRLFLGPGLLTVGILLLPAGLLWTASGQRASFFFSGDWLMATGLGTYYSVLVVADLYATAWLGMRLGLTHRQPRWVPWLTLFYLVVLPAVAFCVPRILIDLPVILIAQDRLRRDFASLARQGYEGTTTRRRPRGRLPPPLPASAASY